MSEYFSTYIRQIKSYSLFKHVLNLEFFTDYKIFFIANYSYGQYSNVRIYIDYKKLSSSVFIKITASLSFIILDFLILNANTNCPLTRIGVSVNPWPADTHLQGTPWARWVSNGRKYIGSIHYHIRGGFRGKWIKQQSMVRPQADNKGCLTYNSIS